MNRTIKDATLKVSHYPDIESLKSHVLAFVKTYNFAKHLKALRWKTPFETIAHASTKDPTIFKISPRHLIPGPNSEPVEQCSGHHYGVAEDGRPFAEREVGGTMAEVCS